jgi:hypothetical protein
VSASATLLEDGGQAASSQEFFRSPEFLRAEGVTHSLVLEEEGGQAALPLIVRAIPDTDKLDAVSPYGYPGAEVNGTAPETGGVDWSEAGLVSVFARERVGEPTLPGAGERSSLQIADPSLPRKSRMSDRQQIRKNERQGYEVSISAGPETTAEDRAGFASVYEQTMTRTRASERYFFERSYFDSVLSSPRTWLFLVTAPGGEPAAGSIAALSDGFLHYYLTGTADEHLRQAPNKNLLEAMIGFAEELRTPLNLGGGIEPGDGLEEFKRGFANRQLPFLTHEIICDEDAYGQLAAGREDAGFFPLYRAV